MKRPLPSSTTIMPSMPCRRVATYASTTILAFILPLLLPKQCAALELDEALLRKPVKKEDCAALLSKAAVADADGSGGLDRVEFNTFWNGLIASNSNADENGDNADEGEQEDEPMITWNANLYDMLLCKCHHTLGQPLSCCDDTTTDDGVEAIITDDDEEDGGEDDNIPPVVWTELPLQLSGEEEDGKPGGPGRPGNKDEKEYLKQLCEDVQDALEEEGIKLEDILSETTSTAVASTTMTEEVDDGSGSNVTSTEATTSIGNFTTTSDFPQDVNVTSDATTTEATTTIGSTTTTGATTTSEEVQFVDPITLTFVGSTNNSDADSVNLDEVTHAVSRVALDVLDEMLAEYVATDEAEEMEFTWVEETTTTSATMSYAEVTEEAAVDNGSTTAITDSTNAVSTTTTAAAAGSITQNTNITTSQGNVTTAEDVRSLMEWSLGMDMAEYFESVVVDVEDVVCPDGLAYAAGGTECLSFEYTISPNPLSASDSTTISWDEFASRFNAAVNEDGALYDALVDEYPETDIVGLGSPGKGESSFDAVMAGASESNRSGTESETDSGLAAGAIVGIALACIVVVLLVVAFVVRRRRGRSNQSLNDSKLSEDLEANEVSADAEWFDGENDGGNGERPDSPSGSSLAALGVASTVATRLTTGDTEVMMTEKQAWTKNEPVV